MRGLSDFFYPFLTLLIHSECVSCCAPLDFRSHICSGCIAGFMPAGAGLLANEMKKKFGNIPEVKDFYSGFIFEDGGTVQKTIHAFKYGGRYRAAIESGKLLARELLKTGMNIKDYLVIPVPLHQYRERERGYNQSCYLARGMSEITGAEVNTALLRRVRITETQTHLNYQERKHNVSGAFAVSSGLISGKKIMLIDDVITSGSTIAECASTLIQSGASEIAIVSFALAK